MSEGRAPAIFFGHGSPMNALPIDQGGGPYADEWRALGRRIGKPKAVLMVSAHWYVDEIAVTAMPAPRTIHDFYGFPPPLFAIQYPAPGAPELADAVRARLAGRDVRADQDWGLDHGAWSVLMHVFPDADVPIAQLSIDQRLPGDAHYAIGRALRGLRDEGVLIAGSGDVVHNLRLMDRAGAGARFDWAERFHAHVKAKLAAGDHAALIAPSGEDARLSIPTPEHYLPLLYVLGAAFEDEAAAFFTDDLALGSISMLGAGFGLLAR